MQKFQFSHWKSFLRASAWLGLGALWAIMPVQRPNTAAALRFDPYAYSTRGDRVEKHYEAYGRRLANYYRALVDEVTKTAPDMLVYLRPHKAMIYGYQMLPSIRPEAARDNHAPGRPVGYSWPWTDHMIDRELKEIVRDEAALHRATQMGSEQRRIILSNLARAYGQHYWRLRNIDAHVQYNRLWQAAIARDRSGYDRQTTLYMAVVERQKIIERLKRIRFNSGSFPVSLDALPGFAALTAGMRMSEALLTREIEQAMQDRGLPDFVKCEWVDDEWVFHVPMVTDIEDRDYLKAVKQIIETAWQLKQGKVGYRVALELTQIAPGQLYAGTRKPKKGQRIDLARHLRRFPSGSAILTTGAGTTHVSGYAILLGPQPLAPRLLAHEFGHILGFRDRYVRGYKDLGKDGFEVMEVPVDDDDIMAATGHGRVERSHFLKLLATRAVRDSQSESRF